MDADPRQTLTVGPNGVLSGTTYYGGSGSSCTFNLINGGACGTVFQLTPPSAPSGSWTHTVIYNFTGMNGDGALPLASVVMGKNGELYGTTEYGGSRLRAFPA